MSKFESHRRRPCRVRPVRLIGPSRPVRHAVAWAKILSGSRS